MDTEAQIVREILRENEYMLRRHLVLSKTVLELLKAEGILTEHAKTRIMLSPSHQQVDVLMQCLDYKGLSSIQKFMDILRQTGHGFLVDNLLDTDVSLTKMSSQTEARALRYRDPPGPSGFAPRRLPPSTAYQPGALHGNTFHRSSVTAGPPPLTSNYGLGLGDRSATLSTLLRARQQPDLIEPRGVINTRDLMAMRSGPPHLYPEIVQPMHQQSNQRYAGMARGLQDVPSTLYDLNQAFASQEQEAQQAMNILHQEETAIRQLMEQNARDQGQVRRKQAAVSDIQDRLKDINFKTNVAYDSTPNPSVGRYRLSQLNKIPWSMHR